MGVRPAPPGVANVSVNVADIVQSAFTRYVPTCATGVSGVELENIKPLPSRYSRPTEANAAELAAPAASAPICVELPLMGAAGVVVLEVAGVVVLEVAGTNADALLPIHP